MGAEDGGELRTEGAVDTRSTAGAGDQVPTPSSTAQVSQVVRGLMGVRRDIS